MNKQQKKKPVKGSRKSLKAGKLLDKALSNSDRVPELIKKVKWECPELAIGIHKIQLGPNSILEFNDGFGNKIEYSGHELMTLFKVSEEKKGAELAADYLRKTNNTLEESLAIAQKRMYELESELKERYVQNRDLQKRLEEFKNQSLDLSAERSASDILKSLFSEVGNRSDIMPIIIQEVNGFLLEKLKNIAEVRSEEADLARKRFQESVEFIKSQLNFKP